MRRRRHCLSPECAHRFTTYETISDEGGTVAAPPAEPVIAPPAPVVPTPAPAPRKKRRLEDLPEFDMEYESLDSFLERRYGREE